MRWSRHSRYRFGGWKGLRKTERATWCAEATDQLEHDKTEQPGKNHGTSKIDMSAGDIIVERPDQTPTCLSGGACLVRDLISCICRRTHDPQTANTREIAASAGPTSPHVKLSRLAAGREATGRADDDEHAHAGQIVVAGRGGLVVDGRISEADSVMQRAAPQANADANAPRGKSRLSLAWRHRGRSGRRTWRGRRLSLMQYMRIEQR